MKSKFFRFCKDRRGVAGIEMAFIMPFMLLLYFGLADLTGLIALDRKVTYAASVVADLVTQNNTTVTSTNITDYFKAAELVMKPTAYSSVRIEVYQYRSVSGSLVSQWNKKNSNGTTCDPPVTAGMNKLMTDGNDLVIAIVCTTYTPYIATFLGEKVLGATTFKMSEQIALRPRASTTLACTGC